MKASDRQVLERVRELTQLTARMRKLHQRARRERSDAPLREVQRLLCEYDDGDAQFFAGLLEEKLDEFTSPNPQEQARLPEALRERQAERACRLESDGYPREAAEARAWGEALLEWHAWRWENRSPAEGSMHRLALVHRGRVLAWAMQAVVQGQLHSELQVWERGAWVQVARSQSRVHLLDWAQVMIRNNQRARGLLQRAQQQLQAQAREQRQAQQRAGRCA